jgi:hypothetical protein
MGAELNMRIKLYIVSQVVISTLEKNKGREMKSAEEDDLGQRPAAGGRGVMRLWKEEMFWVEGTACVKDVR